MGLSFVLDEGEVEKLMNAAKGNRYGHRDATMVFVAYRHGLRASELVDMRWDQVDFRAARLHVRRVKQGTPSVRGRAASAASSALRPEPAGVLKLEPLCGATAFAPMLRCSRVACARLGLIFTSQILRPL
jgi:integrase